MEQSLFITWVLLLVGFALTIKGGDWFVDAAIWISEITHIPKMLIGATVVSICTTLPELLVSTYAVASGVPDMGIGNALGSMICNMCLILGISITFLPAGIYRKSFISKSAFLLLSIILLGVFAFNRNVNYIEGIVLGIVLCVYFIVNVKEALNVRQMNEEEAVPIDKKTVIKNITKFVVGILGIVIGARILVDNGTIIAKAAGVSEQVIGLTIVALGTSLPELITTLSAIIKKEFSLSVGNILGANILNILLIVSTCSIMSPDGLPINLQKATFFSQLTPQAITIDLPVVLFTTLLVVIPGAISGKLRRWQGITLLGCYVLYIGYLGLGLIG